MRLSPSKFLAAALALIASASLAFATLDRTAPLSGDLTAVVTDINEELTQIYAQLPQPLDTLSGTNTYTASIAGMPLLTAVVDGNKYRVKIPNTNTSTTITLDIDSTGAIAVRDKSGNAIAIGGLLANQSYIFEYHGGADNHYRVLSPLATSGESIQDLCVAASDETTTISIGTGKVTFNVPRAITLTGVFAYLRTASSSGLVTVDINEDADAEGGGASTTILSTKITIDANERRSSTAATPPVISDTSLAAHSELTIDIDTAGTNANGLKVCLIGSAT